jgi:hypothetical protein
MAVSLIIGFIGIAEEPLDRLGRHPVLKGALDHGIERV